MLRHTPDLGVRWMIKAFMHAFVYWPSRRWKSNWQRLIADNTVIHSLLQDVSPALLLVSSELISHNEAYIFSIICLWTLCSIGLMQHEVFCLQNYILIHFWNPAEPIVINVIFYFMIIVSYIVSYILFHDPIINTSIFPLGIKIPMWTGFLSEVVAHDMAIVTMK